MNVCFLLGGFQSNGGIGRSTSIVVNALCEREDIQVHTLSYCHTNRPMLYSLSNKIRQHSLFNQSTSMLNALIRKKAIAKVRKLLLENQIDVLVAAGALFYPLAILATRGTATKCYCWEHTSPDVTSDHRFQGLCRRFAIKRADKLIVLTKSAKQYFTEQFHAPTDKLVQIYNPVENCDSEHPYDPSSKKIIAVGRLAYPKNFDRLIQMADHFLREHPDWSIDIYGRGEEQHTLQNLITSLGLSQQIHLMGQVNDLYDRYHLYAFQIMTSRYEGFPMSLLEGAAHRLPLVSFDIPTGPNEIIEDGVNGFLVNKNDDERMIQCINRLIDDAHLRSSMSEAAYSMVQKFKLNDIINQWCDIL